MPKHQSVLNVGASLHQAVEAYFDGHPLDHDDDVKAEHGLHAFDDPYDGLLDTTATGLWS